MEREGGSGPGVDEMERVNTHPSADCGEETEEEKKGPAAYTQTALTPLTSRPSRRQSLPSSRTAPISLTHGLVLLLAPPQPTNTTGEGLRRHNLRPFGPSPRGPSLLQSTLPAFTLRPVDSGVRNSG